MSETMHRNRKQQFDHTYNQDDIGAYASDAIAWDWRLPPTVRSYAHAETQSGQRVLDIGGGYGLNPALARTPVKVADTYRELLAWYTSSERSHLDTHQRLALDRENLPARTGNSHWTGIDIADRALAFAADRDLYQQTIAADLSDTATRLAIDPLDRHDLLLATGSFGYIGPKAVTELARVARNATWLFTLLSWEDLTEWRDAFDQNGLRLELLDTVAQRRGTSDELTAMRHALTENTARTPVWSILDAGYLPAYLLRSTSP